MTMDEFATLIDTVYHDLWPRAAREMAPRVRKVLWGCCRRVTLEQASDALESHASSSRFACTPADLSKLLKAEREPVSADQERQSRWHVSAEYQAICEREEPVIAQTMAELTDEQAEQHKASQLEDWRFGWLSERPITSMAWRKLIYRRVRDGVAPTDLPHDPIPERPQVASIATSPAPAHSGPVGEALFRGARQ